MTLRSAALAALLPLALSLAGCGGDDPAPTSDAAPNDDRDALAAPACDPPPPGDVDGGYPADQLPFVAERAAELAEQYDATEGRYCIDDGEIVYVLVFDQPRDGFDSLSVCGSVFNSFEGDFEHAHLVYADGDQRCG